MNTEREFLRKLAEAKTEDEKTWLTTKRLIDSLPEDLQTIVYSAAIPHWFNEKILRALNPKLSRKIKGLYTKLQNLPFVEKYENRGHNIHELTRRLLLDFLWKRKKEYYVLSSNNLAVYYENSKKTALKKIEKKLRETKELKNTKKENKNIQNWLTKNSDILIAVSTSSNIEYIYHLVIAHPTKGLDAFRNAGWSYHDKFDFSFTNLNSLLESIGEHIVARRVKGRLLGWERLFKGFISFYHFDNLNAITYFSNIIKENYPDKKLNADACFRLGQVYLRVSKFPKARSYHKEALKIYRSGKNKLGEANCISSLGDMHLSSSEISKARAHFEEALPIYIEIKNLRGEANCMRSLGKIYMLLLDLPKADEYFNKALLLVRTIKDKLGEADCLRNLGSIHISLSDFSKAGIFYNEAEVAYREYIKLNPSQHQGYNNLGVLLSNDHFKRYDEAEATYRKAIELYPSDAATYSNLGTLCPTIISNAMMKPKQPIAKPLN